MQSPPSEIEIKLELTIDQWRRLRDRIRSDGGAEGAQPSENRTLRSIYFDTPTWLLREAGMALRLRQHGDQWIQTLKAGRSLEGGISRAFEIEAEVETCQPSLGAIRDKTWRRKVTKLVRPSELVAVFETTVERLSVRTTTPDGAVVEVALDRGTISAGSRKEHVREIELELKAGAPGALLDVARDVISTGPFVPSRYNKAERGYRLAGSDGREALSATKSQPIEITSRTETSAAISQICGVTTRHVLHNWRVLWESDVPAAAHQMRVGLRRFRTALRLMDTTLDSADLERLSAAARKLGRDVGQVRNVHVLMSELIAPLSGHSCFADGIAKLTADLGKTSQSQRHDLLNKLQGAEYGLFQAELGLLPEIVKARAAAHPNRLEQHVERLANRTIKKLLRRVRRRGRNLAQLSIEERHELRKSVKPLRYALEFFALLYPERRIAQLLGTTAEMQEALGYLNDAALAQTLPEIISTEAGKDATVQRAVGAVQGWHAARAERAWDEFPQTWQKFERAAKLIED